MVVEVGSGGLRGRMWAANGVRKPMSPLEGRMKLDAGLGRTARSESVNGETGLANVKSGGLWLVDEGVANLPFVNGEMGLANVKLGDLFLVRSQVRRSPIRQRQNGTRKYEVDPRRRAPTWRASAWWKG